MEKSPQIQWSTGLIVKEFGLIRILENYPLLDSWLTVTDDLSEEDKVVLEKRRKKLLKKVNSWNEETLKMKFTE